MEVNDSASNEIAVKPESEVIRRRSRKRNIIVFVVVCALNIALLVLLATQLLTPAAGQKQETTASSNSQIGDINTPLQGKPMPDFTLPTLGSSTSMHLAAFKGKPIVLNFWASWCDTCNQEAPLLQKTWPQLQQKDVVFIGIDGPEKNGPAFLKQYSITYPNVQDTFDGATAIAYGVTSFPETVFINQNGLVVAKWIGPLNEQGLQFELSKLAVH